MLLGKGIDHYLRIGRQLRAEHPGGPRGHTKVSQYHCPIVFLLPPLMRSGSRFAARTTPPVEAQ